jgi:hypothetical protein
MADRSEPSHIHKQQSPAVELENGPRSYWAQSIVRLMHEHSFVGQRVAVGFFGGALP